MVKQARADLQELKDLVEASNELIEFIKLHQSHTESSSPAVQKSSWLGNFINRWFGSPVLKKKQELKFRTGSVEVVPATTRFDSYNPTTRYYSGDTGSNLEKPKEKPSSRKDAYIENFSNLEMNSKKDERRLDGAPNAYENRDNGKFGSFPVYDDYSEDFPSLTKSAIIPERR